MEVNEYCPISNRQIFNACWPSEDVWHRKIGQLCFRYWLLDCLEPSHSENQYCFILIGLIHRNLIQTAILLLQKCISKRCLLNTNSYDVPFNRELFLALLATGDFPSQRPMTRSFDVIFDLRMIKRLGKQSWGWWFETPSRSLWRHCNAYSVRDHNMSPSDIHLIGA